MQSFVLDAAENPFNVIEPGKRPRVTLTPTLALKDGKPFLAFAVQGGDTQDQNLLQFFLNVVEFGMNVQEAAEAPNINSYQMRSSFGDARVAARAACSTLNESCRPGCGTSCAKMGYTLETRRAHVGPDHRDLVRPRARHDVGRRRATTARTTASPGSSGRHPPGGARPARFPGAGFPGRSWRDCHTLGA